MTTLYAAKSGVTTNLYTVDPETGTPTDLTIDLGVGVTGLAWDGVAGTMYLITSPDSGVNPNHLYTVNLNTSAITHIGALGYQLADISFKSDGTLWGIGDSAGPDGGFIYTINKSTGAATPSWSTSAIGGCAFDAADKLWLWDDSNGAVSTMNVGTGAETIIAASTSSPGAGGGIAAEAIGADGVLDAWATGLGTPYLVSLNLSPAPATGSSRFFAVDSPYNTSGSSVEDGNSATWVGDLIGAGITNLYINASVFTDAVYSVLVGRDAGWAYKNVYGGGYTLREAGVPLSNGMFVPSDPDHGVIIYDESSGIFYNPVGGLDGNGDFATDSASGLASFLNTRSGWWQQQGQEMLSQDAAGSLYLPGMVFAEELANGVIPHALLCSLPSNLIRGPSNSSVYPGPLIDAGAFRSPATRSDGTGNSGRIPMGARLKIDPLVDVTTLSANTYVRMILLAIQVYGLIVIDSSGSTNAIILYAPHTGGPGYPYTPGSPSPTYPAGVVDTLIPDITSSLIVVTADDPPTYETRVTMSAVPGGPVYSG